MLTGGNLGHSVTGTTIAWDAITQNITDGLKVCYNNTGLRLRIANT
jgi:hypothetical protein